MKKNKKQLRLEDAMVPVEEQPYEVPENWCWTKLGVTISISKEKTDDFSDISVKYVGLEHLESNKGLNGYGTTEGIKSLKNIFHTGQILYGKLRPYLNKHDIASFDGVCSTDILVIDVKNVVDAQFVNKFLDMDSFISYTVNNSKGINLPRVSGETIMDAAFPLPPLPEQQRIVERIESLFSKLDEAKEKAQEALESFEERQVAILHKAFKGELTLQWRTEHGLDMNSWRDVPLKDCGRWFGGGTPTTSKKEYWEGGDILWITSKDMKEKIIKDSLMHVTMVGVENSSANYCEEPAVLFVMRSGILRRVFPVSMVRRPFTVNQDLKACVPEGILQEYLYWHCTGFEKDIRDNCMKSGTTVESVEAKKLYEYEISVAGIDEQKEIVNRIEELLNKEVAAYEVAENVIESIELVKKSILAKAFRGELGTNNPSEESSIELLKQVIKE
ncbi:MAG: hypothetical protein E7279_00670 [Lachnospiraceae bacterium]|nr:hypothetical protein [Lachnospiraceae bacterium]